MDIDNNKQNTGGNTGSGWAQAVEIMSEISTWIVVPIVGALVAGKALDTHFGTKPTIFLALTGFAFLITCFGMYRVVKNYINKLKDSEKKDLDKKI